MDGFRNQASSGAGGSIVVEDLAELHGAVRLMHLALEAAQAAEPSVQWFAFGGTQFSVPQLLSVYAYAMARGWYGSDEIADRVGGDGCLKYLAGPQAPGAETLRRFRRENAGLVRSAMAFLVSRILGQMDALPRLGFDPRAEAARRFWRAVAADSLQLEA
jgi:hypothetical protein